LTRARGRELLLSSIGLVSRTSIIMPQSIWSQCYRAFYACNLRICCNMLEIFIFASFLWASNQPTLDKGTWKGHHSGRLLRWSGRKSRALTSRDMSSCARTLHCYVCHCAFMSHTSKVRLLCRMTFMLHSRLFQHICHFVA
jgi:hypothetical protein